jgi:sugar transferase (PEP-CTERM/EpsH1 system associated)
LEKVTSTGCQFYWALRREKFGLILANILYLVHRLPYPPDKGDKVRSFNLLKHLLASHRVFLGAFLDDPRDQEYIPILRGLCEEVQIVELNVKRAKLNSVIGLALGESLTVNFYKNKKMVHWVNEIYRTKNIDATVVFSSAMAYFVPKLKYGSTLVDFVDVDSEKWKQYAQARNWPMSWIFNRESRYLLDFEKSISREVKRTFLVTDEEVELYRKLAPTACERVSPLMNGVDEVYFSPTEGRPSPFINCNGEDGEVPIVFTGAMDYWPNVDAVQWFVKSILPKLLNVNSRIVFYVVGRNPTGAVEALNSNNVKVTGTVADVRPYLQHAAVVVAPLRVARGIQNKILEAMAMAKPVVASESCVNVIGAKEGYEIFSANNEFIFYEKIIKLLKNPAKAESVGRAARNKVISDFSWRAHLGKIDKYISDGEVKVH